LSLLATRSVQELVIKARRKLGLMQHQFARAVGSSVRTVGRWEGGRSAPAPEHLHVVAALLHPIDPTLAHDAANLGGKTLEELGLIRPPPPVEPPSVELGGSRATPPDAGAVQARTRVLVDAILFAAFEALGTSPATFDTVRAAVRAAFAHARDLGIDPARVAEVLSPPPAPAKPEAALAEPAGESEPRARALSGRGRRKTREGRR
jgi:transcriptional regulator with XRE-family HTH domain